MKSKPLTEDRAWLTAIAEAQGGDKDTRDRLVDENMGLVHMVAGRFLGRGLDMEELSQIGVIGLLKAIDRFDATLPYAFSTYAVPLIMGEIRRFLRDDGMIHVSRQVKENARKIAIVRERMKKTDNKEPTIEELKQETRLEYEDIILAVQAGTVESIQKPLASEGRSVTLEEQLEDKRRFEGAVLDRIALEQALQELGERESRLIQLRYMEDRTQAEVARLMGTNQVAVSRLEKKVLGQMRRRLS
ncbi:MAG: sigma-70 family RNA polymerase sigma factor [Muribaculaceae bacterium]|nr:sigma-70 family RNA polymerase sigma factor [Roseburia sp.]MCM1432046.1 sigma-70 family RNA polymerase sigma factor [Muribaculaceae bacterium]MCM1493918.1 sigma-70 family RNA polymerase sigma factor [Muribaculaceae bacterium]